VGVQIRCDTGGIEPEKDYTSANRKGSDNCNLRIGLSYINESKTMSLGRSNKVKVDWN
jgi:hypothetical protein